jgi:endonuclease/exonuclease/phosphatase (EEP) superfamily protein YafD
MEPSMKLLSYNVQTGKHIDRVIDWVNRLPEYEIVCFQEFPKDKIAESIKFLGRISYGYRFAPSFTKRAKVFGQLTLFRTDRLHLKKSIILPLGVNRVEQSILRTTIARSALITTLRYQKRTITVVNIHGVAFASNRLKMKKIQHIIEKLGRVVTPVVMAGDYNISSVVGKRALVRSMLKAGFDGYPAKIATHRVGIFRHQFDYIFTRKCFLRKLRVDRIKFSDHYPIHATLTITR